MLTLADLAQLLVFILPAYFANAAPVLFKTGRSKTPIDMKMRFYDSRRVLGEGKTWVGFFTGVATGTAVGYMTWALGMLRIYPTMEQHLLVAFLLSLGTMTGDVIGSFLKRRLAMKKGRPLFLMDQLSFYVVAILFILPWRPQALDIAMFVVLGAVTALVHYYANVLAYKAGLKRVPW